MVMPKIIPKVKAHTLLSLIVCREVIAAFSASVSHVFTGRLLLGHE